MRFQWTQRPFFDKLLEYKLCFQRWAKEFLLRGNPKPTIYQIYNFLCITTKSPSRLPNTCLGLMHIGPAYASIEVNSYHDASWQVPGRPKTPKPSARNPKTLKPLKPPKPFWVPLLAGRCHPTRPCGVRRRAGAVKFSDDSGQNKSCFGLPEYP